MLPKIDWFGTDFFGEIDSTTFSLFSLIDSNYDGVFNLLLIETIETLFKRICIRLIN